MTRSLAALLISVSALGLSACFGAPAGGLGPEPLTPASRFTLQVEPGVDRIALSVHEQGLSAAQQRALYDITGRFSREGAPALTVEAPAGGDPVANAFAFRVKEQLERIAGQGRVQIVSYPAPDPQAPVLVGFESLRAVVEQCGTYWTSLTRTRDNESSVNFGCAVTANLAAQIENPRDIITPRAMTPANAGRRAVVFDHYRKGEATAAPQEELVANHRVSQAVN